MHVYHLTEIGEAVPPIHAPLFFGRYLAPVGADGTVVCDNHRFAIDGGPLPAGEEVLIWCSHEYFCCPVPEFTALHSEY